MTIIDVDAHFEPPHDWLEHFPELAGRVPARFPESDPRVPNAVDTAEAFAFFVSDDLLRHVPVGERMSIDSLVTPAMEAIYDVELSRTMGYEGASMSKALVGSATAERIAWMDARGIDRQNVISGAGYTLARIIEDPALGRAVLEAVNTWMTDHTRDHADRLMPVTNLRFDDVDWAVGEMRRMRARGSRSFLVSAEPTNNVPPTSPEFDPIWDAAVELGMVALLHIGMAPAMIHPGWAATRNSSLIRFLSSTQLAQGAQVFLHAMILEGVFERHPKLTVLISELGIDWFYPAVAQIELMAAPGVSPLVIGDYDLPLTPEEYVRRNVRISPLPAPHQSPLRLLQTLPEVVVFSSDYPHFEGSDDPVTHYDHVLADVDDHVVEGFLHGNIEASYAMTGDPL